jgi:phospholipid-binding lipoprotein MlaA
MRSGIGHAARLACCGLLVLAAGCATVPRDPVALAAFKATNDPLEPLNRKTFAFNQGVDRALLKPLAKGYVWAIPGRGRDGIRNFIRNLHEPIVFFNNVLQGQFKRALTTAGRFVVNSTAGVAGVMDFAGRHGLARQHGDFGAASGGPVEPARYGRHDRGSFRQPVPVAGAALRVRRQPERGRGGDWRHRRALA